MKLAFCQVVFSVLLMTFAGRTKTAAGRYRGAIQVAQQLQQSQKRLPKEAVSTEGLLQVTGLTMEDRDMHSKEGFLSGAGKCSVGVKTSSSKY